MNSGFKKLPILFSTLFLIVSCATLVIIYKEIDKTKKTTEELESKWYAEVEKRKEMKNLDKSIKLIEEDRLQLDKHFAQSSDVVPFLNTLEKLAKEAGAEAQVSSVDILKDNKGLSVNLKTEGSFSAIFKALQLLENSPYQLEVVGFDVQRITAGDVSLEGSSSRWEGLFKIRLISFLP